MAGAAVQGPAGPPGPVPDPLEPEHWRRQLAAAWPRFLARRADWLRQGGEVAEGITRDLLRVVLFWPDAAVAAAPGPGLLLGRPGARCYVALARPGAIAARRPGACPLVRRAAGCARVQGAAHSGACDGGIFYLEDSVGPTRRERVRVWLGQTLPPPELWWATPAGLPLRRLPPQGAFAWDQSPAASAAAPPLHPQYGLPAGCFAYAGDGRNPRTWKLPFRHRDGRPDPRRLAAAVAQVTGGRQPHPLGVPELEMGLVIRRLAQAARELGLMPPHCVAPSPAMVRLAAAEQRLAAATVPERLGPVPTDARVGQLRRWL